MGNPKTGKNMIEYGEVFNSSLTAGQTKTGTVRTDDYGKRLIGFRIREVTTAGTVSIQLTFKDGDGNQAVIDKVGGTGSISGVTAASDGINTIQNIAFISTNGIIEIPIFGDWTVQAVDSGSGTSNFVVDAILIKEFAEY